MRRTRFGSLTCTLVDSLPEGVRPKNLVVLCHGFGAPGDDLVSLADALFGRAPALRASTTFVFPEAPIAMTEYGGDARAWWRLDADRYFDKVMRGQAEPFMRYTPEGLPEARRALRGALEAMTLDLQVPITRVVLGGFSQGAMVAVDAALRLDEPPAGLAILSGAGVATDDWERLAAKRKGLPVMQSHGSSDTMLPFVGATALEALLTKAGLTVDFVRFAGGHAIPPTALDALAALLVRVLG